MIAMSETRLRDAFRAARAKTVFQEGMVLKGMPGHTREVAHLPDSSSGRETSECYAAGTALGECAEAEGLRMLSELAELQIADPADPQYGGFRWYREETRIHDSNAAFFITMPLALVRLVRPERVPDAHLSLIDGMMRHALHWFAKECRHPILYYPNKILSDGALLLAIASLVGSEEHYRLAAAFFVKWDAYTEARGWGWGENCSATYVKIMLDALQTACTVLERDTAQAGLLAKLRRRMRQLCEFVHFHGGHEFVPTIRSYNFSGDPHHDSLIWALTGLEPPSPESSLPADTIRNINVLLLFAGTDFRQPQPIVPRVREERIFADSFSCTWIGSHGRMGSITRFPAMPGSYQQDSWGLGWQSFPVGFCVDGEHVAYLRWFVREGGDVRTHPAEVQQRGYLNTVLFEGPWHPQVLTRSAQRENLLLAVRSLGPVHHAAEEIADEWVLHDFGGELFLREIVSGRGPRQWAVLKYARSAVCLTALSGLAAAGLSRRPGALTVLREPDRVRIRQTLAREAGQIVFHPRLETGWAAVMIDGAASMEQIAEFLQRIDLADEVVFDEQVARAEYMKKREISLLLDGAEAVALSVDPYENAH